MRGKIVIIKYDKKRRTAAFYNAGGWVYSVDEAQDFGDENSAIDTAKEINEHDCIIAVAEYKQQNQ